MNALGRILVVCAVLMVAVPARQASAAVLQQVQSGVATSNANGITSVVLTSIDITKSILIFQTRTNTTAPGGSTVRGRLMSSTLLEFERVTAETAPITIVWYVATFASGVTVQRGETVQTTTAISAVITAVTLNRSFVLFSKTPLSGEAEWSNDDAVAGDLLDTTHVQFRSELLNVGHRIAWQVITYTNGADISVQRPLTTMTMTGTTTSVTATITPVNLAKTFVLASWRTTGTGTDVGSRMLRAQLSNDSTVTVDRSATGNADNITEVAWQVIEFKDESIVWSGLASFGTTQAQATAVLGYPDVNITRSVGFISGQGGSGQNMGRTNWTTNGNIGVGTATALITPYQITLDRGNTQGQAEVAWFVVQFDGGMPFKSGSFTKPVTTGAQVIPHGLGQVPKAMLLWAEGTSRDDITLRGSATGSATGLAGTSAADVASITSADGAAAFNIVTPATFTTTYPNELVLAFVSAGGSTFQTQSITSVTGAGLTWVLVRRQNTRPGTAEIWRTFAATPVTNQAITANLTLSATSSITVIGFTGVDETGVNGAGAVGASNGASANPGLPSVSLTTTRNNSGVMGVGNDTSSATNRTVGAGESMVHEYHPTNTTYWMQGLTAPVSPIGTATINDTAPSTRYNMAIVEVLPYLAGTPASYTVTVDRPTGTVEDDVMIATIAYRPSSATITPPAGSTWTLVRTTTSVAGSPNSMATYRRVASGSEPASYSWSLSTTSGAVGSILSFAGVDVTNPIDVENGSLTASALTHTAPAVTTTVAKAMIVTAHAFASAATWNPAPTGLAEAVDTTSQAAPNTNGQSIEVNYGIRAAAGLTPTYVATASGNADSGNVETLALRPASHPYFSFGMTDGTTSRSASSSSVDIAGLSNTSHRTATTPLTIVQSHLAGGSLVAEAAFTSWNDTNVTLNWTTNDATASVIHYIAVGGSDMSAKVVNWTTGTGTGDRAVVGVGFKPNLVINAHAGFQQTAAPPSNMANGAFGLGVMSAEGNQWANGFFSLDNAGTTDTQRGQRTDAALYAFDQSLAVQKKASFVTMDTGGFTVNFSNSTSANDMQVFSLALKGLNATVGSFDKSTAAQPASQAFTGVGFQPALALFSSFQDVTQAALTPVAEARFGFGATDGTTNSASTFEDLDASASSDAAGSDTAAKVFAKINNSTSVVDAAADLTTFDPDGFTLNWTTNDGIATEILFLALAPMSNSEVRLISFEGAKYDSGVLLKWKTGYEIDNLGFNVYRKIDGDLTRVNASLIAGSGLQSGRDGVVSSERTYARWDTDSPSNDPSVTYWLEDVEFNGKTTMHGPAIVAVPEPQEPTTADSDGLDAPGGTDAVTAARRIFFSYNDDPASAGPRVAPTVAQEVTDQWALTGTAAVKIGIRKQGWYRVSRNELVLAGLGTQVDPQTLQLFVNGTEQAIRVNGAVATSFDAIEFYATGVDTAYTDTRTYWLQSGIQPGLRIVLNAGGALTTSSSTSFSSMLRRKDRTIYFAALNNGDTENWFGPTVFPEPATPDPDDPATPTVTFALTNLDRLAAPTARLTITMQGVASNSGAPAPHRIGVVVNGVAPGYEMEYDGQAHVSLGFEVPMADLNDGENAVTLVARGGDMDVSQLDSIRLDYPHAYQADADRLRFTVEAPASITVGGFAGSSIRVVDITDRAAPILLSATSATASGVSTVTAQVPGSGPRTLMAFSDETVATPEFVRANRPSNLHASSNASDYVVVSHADFISAMAPLTALRDGEGHHSAVVDIEDVYDEFSFGEKTPQALRDFLQWANATWQTKPKFVVLAGDATIDPRDYEGYGNGDFVPTKEVPMTYTALETASDDWFVDYNDDGLPDAAIGRLSIRTPAQAATMVAKIVDYNPNAQEPWTKNVLLVADHYDGTTSFDRSSQSLAALTPFGYTADQISAGQVGDVAASQTLTNSVNSGQLIVNYNGHGSVYRWSDGSLLTNGLVPSWQNLARLPLVVAMNCLNGLFNGIYGEESLAEALQRSPDGGAVAVWASSSLTPPATQALVNQELFRLIFGGTYATLGESIKAAKRVVSNSDLRRSWVFFGDPAMRLAGQFPVAAAPPPPPPQAPPPPVDPAAPITDPPVVAPPPPVDPPAPPVEPPLALPSPPPPAPSPDPSSPSPAPTPDPQVSALPGAPIGLTSSVFGSTLVLTWAPAASGAAPGWYVIEAGSFAGALDFVQPTGNLARSFTADGVGNGTYFVRVRAANAAGVGAASNEVIVVVGTGAGPAPTTGAPSAPTGLISVVNGAAITFAWHAPTAGGVPQTYWIHAGSSLGASDLASFSTGNAATGFSVASVAAGTYYVRVRAANDAGVSDASNEIVVFIAGLTVCSSPPDPPTGLQYGVTGSTVTLVWNAPAGSPTSNSIEAGSSSGAADLLVSDTGSTASRMVATGVSAGTYFVRVRARNACGESGLSNEVVIVVP